MGCILHSSKMFKDPFCIRFGRLHNRTDGRFKRLREDGIGEGVQGECYSQRARDPRHHLRHPGYVGQRRDIAQHFGKIALREAGYAGPTRRESSQYCQRSEQHVDQRYCEEGYAGCRVYRRSHSLMTAYVAEQVDRGADGSSTECLLDGAEQKMLGISPFDTIFRAGSFEPRFSR